MQPLFTPPASYQLPLSRGQDLVVDFQNQDSNGNAVNYPDGATVTLVIDRVAGGSPSVSTAATISGNHAVCYLSHTTTDHIYDGAQWRCVAVIPGGLGTPATVNVVLVNGTVSKGDGQMSSAGSNEPHAVPVSTETDAVVLVVPTPGPPGARGPAGWDSYFIDNYGADPTGESSSDAAVTAAMTAMGGNPGVLVFGAGTYRLSNTMTLTNGYQGVAGQGMGVTTLNWVGTGDCIRMYDPAATFPSKTGFISGLKIDGYEAGPDSTGLHVGDTYNLRIRDVWVADFVASGSVGVLMDNTVAITERAEVRITVDNCDTAVVFQCEDSETPSFDYGDWDFIVNCFANQNGVVIKGSAQIIHGNLSIRGDCYNTVMNGRYLAGTGWSSTETNTGVLLTVGTGSGTPYLEQTNLVVSVECAGIAETAPCHTTIKIAAGADLWCTGILSFRFDEGFSWTPGTNDGWFSFAGYKNVDSTFGVMTAPQSFSVSGAVGSPYPGTAQGTELQLNTGNIIQCILASGANALTLSHTGMSGSAMWDIVLVQPSTGDGTVTLPGNVTVLPAYATSLPLTYTANAQDLFRLVTYNMSDFYIFPIGYQTQSAPQYWESPPKGGVTTLPRLEFNTALPTTTGQMNITYFQAPPGIGATTQVAVSTGDTAAANVTLAKIALYTVDASGNLTLVGDADISSVITTTYTNTPVTFDVTFIPGRIYAVGVLIAAETMPHMCGQFTVADANYAPPLCSLVTGPLESVPASVSASSLSGNYLMLYARFS